MWTSDITAEIRDLFAAWQEPQGEDLRLRWQAWNKEHARQAKKRRNERDRFLIKVIRARHKPWRPTPAAPRPDLEQRNRDQRAERQARARLRAQETQNPNLPYPDPRWLFERIANRVHKGAR